jgi:hypothetical protein
LTNQVGKLVARVVYDIITVALLIAFKETFFESSFGALLWLILLIGLVLLPWVGFLRKMFKK